MSRNGALLCLLLVSLVASAQEPLKQRGNGDYPSGVIRVDAGTHILLSMINSVSTKQAAVGDRIYLQTAFPVLSNGRIVIPQGSWVTGTVTEVKRPGRMKGRGSLQVRFDSLTLPNGVSRIFHSDLGAIDSTSNETLEREGSKVKSAGNKTKDSVTVVGTTAAGTVIGSGVGGALGHAGMGAGVGAASGAAAGLIGVLASRGPDAVLAKGSTVEMVLDRSLSFNESELDSSRGTPRAKLEGAGARSHVQF
jgi:hypothetical protein